MRQEFIDPLSAPLAAMSTTSPDTAEAHEGVVMTGVGTKVPDYCLGSNAARKFVVEAKKPRCSIRDDVSPPFQIRHSELYLKKGHGACL